jgi:hypothetical protein
MERLNLAVVENKDGHRLSIAPDPSGELRSIIQAIPEIKTLEKYCKSGGIREVIDQLEYGMKVESVRSPQIGPLIAGAYEFAMNRGLQACPLDYLEDVLFAFVKRNDSSKGITAERLFDSLRSRFPNEVRFHVDRQGRRAFVLVSGNASARLSDLLWPMA